MKRSDTRILTTHTGSLPRPKDLIELLRDREEGQLRSESELRERTRAAVLETVRKQAETGLSIVNDGEQGRVDSTTNFIEHPVARRRSPPRFGSLVVIGP